MVYMTFPHNLTEEEKKLQRKFAELRKKKKQLSALRAPKPEQKEQEKDALKRANEDAADNTEQAKKLFRSGQIKVKEKKDPQTFKRSKRQKDTEKSVVGFHPFSPTHSSENEEEHRPESATVTTPKPRIKGLYESFISSKPKPERIRERDAPPKKGNTIHVSGYGVTEEIVRKAGANFGRIINVNVERDKNCAFVTFEKMESADQAISELNGTVVCEVKLRVTMARRQPTFEGLQDASGSSWSTIAASQSQKGTHKDSRQMVIYQEEEDIFSG